MTKSLITKSLEHFLSYYDNNDEKKLVREKFKNICDKTGQYEVPSALFQGRTPRNNRALIPYSHVIKNSLNYEMLKQFKNGVVVEFVNNEFFKEIEKPSEEQSDIFKILKNKLGSDDIVSAMICIRGQGKSSSTIQREAYGKLIKYLENHSIDLSSVLIRRKGEYLTENKKNKKFSIGKGNDKWEGYVFFDIKGGDQQSIKSHKIDKNNKKFFMLFNPSVEYASDKVSNDITLVLTYFALHSIPIQIRKEEWDKIKSELENYLDKQKYLDFKTNKHINLLDYVQNHICLNIEENVLYDPIQSKPINYFDFSLSDRNDNSIDITHEISVKKAKYIYDEDAKEILTPANPLNLYWSKHLSNMMQQDFSLEEYVNLMYDTVKEWDKIKIKRFFNNNLSQKSE